MAPTIFLSDKDISVALSDKEMSGKIDSSN